MDEEIKSITGDFFTCSTFKNESSLPLMLSTYTALPPILDDFSEETFGTFELCTMDSKEILNISSHIPVKILLQPFEEYHVTLRVLLKSHKASSKHFKNQNNNNDTEVMTDMMKALKYTLMPRIGFTYSRHDISTMNGCMFNSSIFREDTSVMLPTIIKNTSTNLQLSSNKTTNYETVIALKHSYFSIIATTNIQDMNQRVINTSHGIMLDINSPVTFTYQIWASVLLQPQDLIPPQLMVQLLPVKHWIPMGETLIYLNPVSISSTQNNNEISYTSNHIETVNNDVLRKWKFEFSCQYISIRYGETRPAPVSVKLVSSPPGEKNRGKNCFGETRILSTNVKSPIYIHTTAQLQPEMPLLYICSSIQ